MSREKRDLPGIIRPLDQSPAVISLPPCDSSHVTGGLDPVAPPAKDLQVIPCPLVTSHGYGPDVVEDIGVVVIRASRGAGFGYHLPAPCTLPSLLVPDTSSHAGNRGSHVKPVLHAAGGLAAEGVFASRCEVFSLAAAMGAGTPQDPLLLLLGILAVFTHYHVQISPS